MRKIILAVLAGQMVVSGAAFAQPAPGPKDKTAAANYGPDLPVSAAGANNNNNNVSASALSGLAAKPTPGTFVVRMGGRVNVQAGVSNSH
jgi:hypothetical protein